MSLYVGTSGVERYHMDLHDGQSQILAKKFVLARFSTPCITCGKSPAAYSRWGASSSQA